MKWFLAIVAAISIAFAVSGVWQILSPSYSDAQIAASLVDTWESHALLTRTALVLLSVFACITIAFCILAGRQLRLPCCVALSAVLVAFGAQLAAHIILTNHVARVTGQQFGPVFGLL